MTTRISAAVSRGFDRAVTTTFGPYQTAVVRIGTAAVFLFLLLREWPNRHELYGPDGPLSWEVAWHQVNSTGGLSVFMWTDGTLWFELAYHFAIVAAVLMLTGWHTRAASVLFMISVMSVHHRNPFITNGGENVLHLMSIYLVATRCGQVWSLDSRRKRTATGSDISGPVVWGALGVALVVVTALGWLTWGWVLVFGTLWAIQGAWWAVRRFAPGEPRSVLDMLGTLAHNTGVLVIVGQICVIYASTGWYKIMGEKWLDGTAAYYPMQLDLFSPWPVLSELVTSYGPAVMAMTWTTVIVQVAFPFTLFHRQIKNVLLAVLIIEHAGIGLLLGLPIFSGAIIAADLIFLPTALLLWIDRKVTRRPAEAPSEAVEPEPEKEAVTA